MQEHSFLWHDYETFGVNPRRDRPAQFAAIRTDADLNEIGEPIMLYCQPAPDFLPDPQSCLITGITPQRCLELGLPEYQFAQKIEQELALPGTIGVGYNTIRFDDEITRFMLWRNLYDPYAREWQNQCGRWDILDMVRTAYALRPDGITWPKNEEGRVSFKLELLTQANGITHETAHDALSDVRATIALARLIRERQPKLFEFCLSLRKKETVAQEIGFHLQPHKPFLHVSGMFPVERGCLALMWPLALHPQNKNEIIAWDLEYDPRELATLDADTVRQRMFTASKDLPEGVSRLPIKSIHLNKSPVVIRNLKTLSAEMAAQWQLDMPQALAHASAAMALPDMPALWQQVYQRPAGEQVDVDEDLYGGFVGTGDRRQLNTLRSLPGAKLAQANYQFQDLRLEELLFRYRARNFPATLSEVEQEQWQAHCAARLLEGEAGALNVDGYFSRIDQFAEQATDQQQAILDALYDYAEMIVPAH
jgi:exodeoxyribonuclease-1